MVHQRGRNQHARQSKWHQESHKLVADELKTYWVFPLQKPWGQSQQLIIPAERSYFSCELSFFVEIRTVPRPSAGIEHHSRSLARHVHRQKNIVQNGVLG